MREYPKIQSLFKRDMNAPGHPLILGEYSMPEFGYLEDNIWAFTEKIDGTNVRVHYDGSSITFGGRTDKAMLPADLLNALVNRFLPQLDIFRKLFRNDTYSEIDVHLYGEGYGGKIQKGGNYRPDPDFILFDIQVGNWWLRRADVEEIAVSLSCPVVPIVGYGNLNKLVEIVKGGLRSAIGDCMAEGVVAKPTIELKARSGGRIITKLKTRDFHPKGGLGDAYENPTKSKESGCKREIS